MMPELNNLTKLQILSDAAAFIEEEARCLFESHKNPKTNEIEEADVAARHRRELILASRLRQYASEIKKNSLLV